MTAKGRTPEEWISFLLTLMDYTDGKTDWNAVANDTGAYKAGKFVRQAYTNLRTKYQPLAGSVDSSSVPATPKSTTTKANKPNPGKKRPQAPEDDEEIDEKPKRVRKTKAKKVRADEEDVNGKDSADAKKMEASDDELNGEATVIAEDDE